MHVALGGSARPLETAPGRRTTWPTTAWSRPPSRPASRRPGGGWPGRPAYLPAAGTYPEPVEHCDVCRWSELCRTRRRADDDLSLVAGAATRLRQALKARRRGDPARPRGPGAATAGATRRRGRRGAGARRASRPRIQVRGEDAGPRPSTSCWRRAGCRTARSSRTGADEPAAAAPGRPLLRHRGRPVRARTTASSTSSASSSRGCSDADGEPTFHAFWAIDEAGRVTPEAEKRAFEQTIDLMMDRLAQRSRDPHLPLRAVRADGGRQADGPPRHARGGGGSAAARRRLRGPLPGRSPGPARLGRELLDQEARAALRARARGGSARRRLEHRRLRDAGWRRWRPGPDGRGSPRDGRDARPHRRLQPRRRASPTGGCATGWRSGGRSWPAASATPRAARGRSPSEPGSRARSWPARLAEVARARRAAVPPASPRTRPSAPPSSTRRWLLAQLLSWHRREEKSFWWRYFYLMNDLTDEELSRRARADRRPGARWARWARRPRSTSTATASRSRSTTIEVGTRRARPGHRAARPGSVDRDRRGRLHDRPAARREERRAAPAVAGAVRLRRHARRSRTACCAIGEWVAEHGIDGPRRPKAPAARRLASC